MKTEKMIAAGIFAICKKTGRILLCRRGFLGGQPNTWGVFGGKFEKDIDKNVKENAKREFREETEYGGDFNLSKNVLDVQNDNHLIYYTFAGIFEDEFTPTLDEENQDFGWFYLGEMPENLHPGLKATLERKNKTIEKLILDSAEAKEIEKN
jgi:ADP-ribose pyrophosphatase YjhB (NUDIX family)